VRQSPFRVDKHTEKSKEKDAVETYLINWLETLPGRVKGSTVYRYRNLVNGHMIPCLGSKRLAELRPDAIAAFYAERQKSGLSPTTVQLIHTTLRKALGDAVEYGNIPFNPVARVKPPCRADFEARVPTRQEVQRLLTTADEANDRMGALWTLLALTGARIGEMLALRWDAVSWERRSIAITQSVSIDSERNPIITTPKTARGRCVVSLGTDPTAIEALKRHRARQNVDKLRLGPDYSDNGLVFASAVGTAMSERNAIREYKEALERAGFSKEDRKRIRIHDLRHYHVTDAAHSGANVKDLSARVGHASVAFTLDKYAAAFEGGDSDIADTVGRRLRQSANGKDDAARTGTDDPS